MLLTSFISGMGLYRSELIRCLLLYYKLDSDFEKPCNKFGPIIYFSNTRTYIFGSIEGIQLLGIGVPNWAYF